MYDKIKNPLTGRFVKSTSRLGRSIINNYLNQLGGQNESAEVKVSDIVRNLEKFYPEVFSRERYYESIDTKMTEKPLELKGLSDEERLDLEFNYIQWVRQRRKTWKKITRELVYEDSDKVYKRRSRNYNRLYPEYGEQVTKLRQNI